jgi:hypothetical protein
MSSTSSSSSSSSNQPATWGHLLRLPQINAQWAAAAAAFDAKWQSYDWQGVSSMATEAAAVEQLHKDALQLCRVLADAAPLTVVCNSPSCRTLAEVSEAAASCKACVGCGCRYCSVVCQRGDWKRHKVACRCMAAAGMMCG